MLALQAPLQAGPPIQNISVWVMAALFSVMAAL
jgi:hypothetical protein